MSSELTMVTEGLQFPEGPVAMPNGDVIVCELKSGNLTRVKPDGTKELVAHLGGSPNGAALGPDGKMYVCNSGGWRWTEVAGMTLPGEHGITAGEDYIGGRIQRVDLETGAFEDLYTESDGVPLKAPNDLVFDSAGGFWFTDHGHIYERHRDRTGIHYGKADGSEVHEVIFSVDGPNGIGLSPDEKRLYAAETHTGRVFYWDVQEPGTVPAAPFGNGGQLLAGLPDMQLLDSLAIDGDGWVCVATLVNGGITSISPDGATIQHLATGDPLTTNICFGGDDFGTAFITLSAFGRLAKIAWPRKGLKLPYQ
ncbi:MAG TPA: SMP-30/gluconolactonase/LRE family protein [Acidimicrobiales bacterium]|nr:SMP-30/gluconolactonase/LRE family protein [Acidimicrobiales bacterium]